MGSPRIGPSCQGSPSRDGRRVDKIRRFWHDECMFYLDPPLLPEGLSCSRKPVANARNGCAPCQDGARTTRPWNGCAPRGGAASATPCWPIRPALSPLPGPPPDRTETKRPPAATARNGADPLMGVGGKTAKHTGFAPKAAGSFAAPCAPIPSASFTGRHVPCEGRWGALRTSGSRRQKMPFGYFPQNLPASSQTSWTIPMYFV